MRASGIIARIAILESGPIKLRISHEIVADYCMRGQSTISLAIEHGSNQPGDTVVIIS